MPLAAELAALCALRSPGGGRRRQHPAHDLQEQRARATRALDTGCVATVLPCVR